MDTEKNSEKGKNIVIGILIGIIVCLAIALVFICYNKFIVKDESITNNNKTDSDINNNNSTQMENSIDYSGKYEKDGSDITFIKNSNGYDVEITIFRTAVLTGKTTNISDNKLTIVATTNSEADDIEFVFDYNTKILTVTKSNWNILPNGRTYQFSNTTNSEENSKELSSASSVISSELKSRRFMAKNNIDIDSKALFMKVAENVYLIEVTYTNGSQQLFTTFLVTYNDEKFVFNKIEEEKNHQNKFVNLENHLLKSELAIKELDNIKFYDVSSGKFNLIDSFSKPADESNESLKYRYNEKEVTINEYKSKYAIYEKYNFVKFESYAVELNNENIDAIVK